MNLAPMTMDPITEYFSTLNKLTASTRVTNASGGELPISNAFAWINAKVREMHLAGNKVMFIGNGGSASIASHMAIDFAKCGGVRSVCFNDGSALTCLGNDLGYENVFAFPITMNSDSGDLLMAISSSGQSANILKGVEAARAHDCRLVTFSGFKQDNPLRSMGDINFYVPSSAYGFVEIIHQTLVHAILDLREEWPNSA
ncbi:MAG: SIS domain-containing protein [Rhodospirillales bacterium]|nr:SIS domain-containing protein [Rhodospirillales bacterium]